MVGNRAKTRIDEEKSSVEVCRKSGKELRFGELACLESLLGRV
jgi:hypothetical protein